MDSAGISGSGQGGSNAFLSRLNVMHPSECQSEADYVNIISNKSSRIPETGLDMSYKQYEPEMVKKSLIFSETI